MALGDVHDRCARGGRAAATATNSHGEMVLGDAHDRGRLRLNLHCLGQHVVEHVLAPPAGYGHLPGAPEA